MRYLTLSSLLLLCMGCANTVYKETSPPFADASALQALRPSFTTSLYRAQIDVIGKHLSGLLFFKNLADGSYRVVFTNEMGLNFFDFRFDNHQFEVIHCIDQLNKKPVVNQLRKDIGFFLMTDLDYKQGKAYHQGDRNAYTFPGKKETTTYITDARTKEISQIVNSSTRKPKVIVSLSKVVRGMPDSVFVDHKLFPFTISLKQIQR